MERAIKKRLYVYTIGMFLATVVVVSVITIYYEYRVRYMATVRCRPHRREHRPHCHSFCTYYFMEDKVTRAQQIIRLYCRRQVIQEMVRGICSYMAENIFHLP